MKFGDASAVDPGRLYSILVVAALVSLWWAAGRFGWAEPIFWPSLGAVGERMGLLLEQRFRYVTL